MTYPPTRWPAPLLRLIARLWNDGVNTARPVTQITVPDIAAPDVDIVLSPKGTGAISAHVPDGTAAGGDKRGSRAVDLQTNRSSATQVASGFYSVIISGASNRATAQYSFVGSGSNNTSTNSYSYVGCGNANASTGLYSVVVSGGDNSASGVYSFIGCGQANTASGSNSFVGGGQSNIASGIYSSVGCGIGNQANGDYSAIIGGVNGTTHGIVGYHVFPACNLPITSTRGASQAGLLILGRQTTDATATALASNISTAAGSNQLYLENNSAYSFSGEVIAAVTGAGDTARWTIEGAIKKGASNATTALVGTPTVTMTHNDAGAAAWVVAITADTANGALRVTVTGAASTTIRWVCRLDSTEVKF